jgi:hypothetical protein
MISFIRMELVIIMRRRKTFLAVALLAVAAAPGCGDGKPYQDTSLTEATVSGVVTVKGTPVTEGGTILFNPSNSGRLVPTKSATIGRDGRYTIKTYTGVNVVTYGGDDFVKKYPGLGLRRDAATVVSGENKLDFDIQGEGKFSSYDPSKMPKAKKKR